MQRQIKEILVRLIYCEMLGKDASFGHIKAVNLTQEKTLLEKRTGYLASALFLKDNSEMVILMVNTLQRDLQSPNVYEVAAALSATCKMITRDLIPAVMPIVHSKCITHEAPAVRKKAVQALLRFVQITPALLQENVEIIQRVLYDRDPAVMGSSLSVLYELCKPDPVPYKHLIPAFVSILKQIIDHKLSRDFDYTQSHARIPAPWMQIKLLKILAVLAAGDQKASAEVYEVLSDVMKRADIGINAGYAVIMESIRTPQIRSRPRHECANARRACTPTPSVARCTKVHWPTAVRTGCALQGRRPSSSRKLGF